MSALADRPRDDVERLRAIHLGMIDAVLAGGGIATVAALAAEQLGGKVAIVLPSLDVGDAELKRYVSERLHGRPVEVPDRLAAEVPVRSGDETLGYVIALGTRSPHTQEVLELAALAALTAVTLRDARVSQRRAAAELLEAVRQGADDAVARAERLGADLSHGASALVARPRHADRALATIAQEHPGALAAVRRDGIEALLPDETAARRLAHRLQATMPVGLSPFEPDPDRLGAALRIAELTLELDVDLDELLGGSWRLLLASTPPELDALIDSTVGPAIDSGLLDTARAYLANDANINATAAAIYAHRHTVAEPARARLRELTGLDPQTPSGQAQFTLGLQALDVQRARPRSGPTESAGRQVELHPRRGSTSPHSSGSSVSRIQSSSRPRSSSRTGACAGSAARFAASFGSKTRS